MAVALVSIAMSAAPQGVSLAQTTAPVYLRAIGVPGHADIYPGGIDVDAAGNVYVADTGNDQVVKFLAGTNVPAFRVGTRGAATLAAGSFADPRDVAIGSQHLYVADTGHGVVQVLDPTDGSFVRRLAYPFRVPIGVSVGTDGLGDERILVSNGRSGNVDVFDASETHLFAIPPRLGVTAGTRDAATDLQGNIYVADYRHNAIHKYDRTGTFLLSWGGAGALACQQIPRPYGVDVDDAGRVYVASSNSNKVRAFLGDGTCAGTYGQWGLGEFQLSQLRRVAVTTGTDPKIHAADLWGIKDLIFNLDGTVAGRLGSWPKPPPGSLNEAHRIAVTDAYVFVTNTINHRMERFDLDGSDPISWGTKGVKRTRAEFNWPQGVAVDPTTGNVWAVDTRNSVLKEFGPNGGDPVRAFGQAGTALGSFKWPLAAAFDPLGNLYVADTSNNRVQSFYPTLAFRWHYGTAGSGLTNLRAPSGVTFDPVGGRLLVMDSGNSRIVALDPATGARIAILPIPRGSAPGQILAAQGVAVDGTGALWVADTGNDRVQRFNADGTFSGVVLDGTGAGGVAFNRPVGIAVGPDGLLYVADTWNDRVVVYQP